MKYLGLFQYGEGALFDGRYISESAAVRLRDDPTGPCSDDPNESDQSELSLTLLRTPIVRGGGKVSDKVAVGKEEATEQVKLAIFLRIVVPK